MRIRTNYFPIGSSYYPPFHTPEDWDWDTRRMAEAGLSVIRTEELLASWDYIEPRRGQPDWSWLDRLFELAGQRGIQIILGSGSCNPPIWILEYYPDVQRVSREGMRYPTNTMWGWACVNHPGHRHEVSRYLNLLIDRYGQNPVLLGWQIDNQIGHSTPFREGSPERPRRYAYYCYCDHCARLFREWLQAKYQDIDALNHAWAWDPTHYRYYDWHQIQPPRSLPAEWGNGTAWLDFRRFIHETFTSFVRFQHDLIKARDSRQLTMHNLYNCLGPDLGARSEPNHWDLGGVTDVIGHDMYPSENSFKKDPAYTSWFMDFAYSVARHNHRTMWVPELESGPIGRFSAGPMFATGAKDIKRFNLACLGHGAKMMMYQGYRDWNCIPLTWGALVDFHGQPTPRYHAAAEVNRIIKSHEAFFLDALPAPAQVAIYHSPDNVIVLDGQANEHFLYRALRGVHTALWSRGYAVEFVAPQFVGADTADYKVILLPFVMHMPRAHADRLAAYVKQGGSLVGFAKLAHLDDKGWAWDDCPGAGLSELFGVLETDIEVFEDEPESVTLRVDPRSPLFAGIQAQTVRGYWHRQTFKLAEDVEVLAQFVDGAPAILRRRVGAGQAILIATHLDIAAWEYRDPVACQLFANLMTLCGVSRHLVTTARDQAYVDERVDAHLLEMGEQRAIVINNEGLAEVDLTVAVPGATTATTATELFSEQVLPLVRDSAARFSVHLPAADGVIVMLR